MPAGSAASSEASASTPPVPEPAGEPPPPLEQLSRPQPAPLEPERLVIAVPLEGLLAETGEVVLHSPHGVLRFCLAPPRSTLCAATVRSAAGGCHHLTSAAREDSRLRRWNRR